jgi:FG-GAP-like repeat
LYSGETRQLLRSFDSDAGGGNFGTAFIADAGDVNRDGKADVYIGDYSANTGNGRVHLFSGVDGSVIRRIHGTGREGLGPGRAAGDVDGDGHDDIVAGSYSYSSGGLTGRGRISVFSGRTGEALARFEGPAAGANYGFDAIGLGDINADGKFDFLVGAQPLNQAFIVAGTTDRITIPAFAISSGMSGAWYDPAQSGHGMFVEILADNRFLVWWFAFDPEGNQAWFGGVGTYSGNTATVNVERALGGRWIPNFNPANITRQNWGQLNFRFDSCLRGRVDFSSTTNFGSGSMELTRLTVPAGLVCTQTAAE